MRRKFTLTLCLLVFSVMAFSQYTIRGKLTDDGGRAASGVKVVLVGTSLNTTSDAEGSFNFSNIKAGNYNLIITSADFEPQSQVVNVAEDTDLGALKLKRNLDAEVAMDNDIELDNEEGVSVGSSNFLSASVDVFSKVAAFQWGSVFFRSRGYDNDKQRISFNGVLMNTAQEDTRPLYRDWSGLNDVTRYADELKTGLTPITAGLGSVSSNVSYSTRASSFSKGGRISTALTNYSYTQRINGMYASGMQANGWAYVVAGSRRWAEEGVQDGVKYDAWSYFASVEKKLNEKHSFNFSTFGVPYKKGSVSPNTQEVVDLFGIHYNQYWGWQEGKQRNERLRTSFQPSYFLSHYWKFNENTKLETTLGYRDGHSGYTRLQTGAGYFDATNTFSEFLPKANPVYYRYLPSYEPYRRDYDIITYDNENPETAPIVNNQLNWYYLYKQNNINAQAGKPAAYYLDEQVTESQLYSANSRFQTRLSNAISMNSALSYQYLHSDNYYRIYDLLGGLPINNYDYYNNVDYNKLDDNLFVNEGDRYKASYDLNQHRANFYTLFNVTLRKFDLYLGGDATYTQFWRRGDYQYELLPYNSYGVSAKEEFWNFGVKAGATYKLNGKNYFLLNGFYQTLAPSLKEAYPNADMSNTTASDLQSSKIISGEVSYIRNGKKLYTKITGYYTEILDDIETSQFYDDGIISEDTSTEGGYVYTSLEGVDSRYFGGELGIEYKITPALKIHGAASVGQFTYTNNPSMQVIEVEGAYKTYTIDKVYLKDYKISGTPQHAYNLGIEYRSPKYWWVGLEGNILRRNYVGLNPLKRTDNFVESAPSAITDEEVAQTQARVDELLRQEKFSTEFMLNFTAGKSFRFGNNGLTFSLNVNNVLNNKEIKTGGFEQGYTSTYATADREAKRSTPAWGNRYWFQQGVSFFMNIVYRFQ